MSMLLQLALAVVAFPVLFVAFILFQVSGVHSLMSSTLGNLKQLLGLEAWDFHAHLAESYGPVIKIWGLFGDAQLYIRDPKALHHVLVKDQYVFEETDMFIKSNQLSFGKGLLGTLGEHHRRQRKLLNPVFSIKHMRYMRPIFFKISHQLVDVLKTKITHGPTEIDVLDWNTRVALELIGQGGLGHSFDCLSEHSESSYSRALKTFVPTLAKMNIPRLLLPWVANLGPPAVRRWLVQNIPWQNLNHLAHLVDIMEETSKMIFYPKKAALEKGDDAITLQIGEGRDIMSVLLKANMEAAEKDRLPDSELLAQMSTLTFAAMDTTATALSRILHLLSQNQAVQDRLRDELTSAYLEAGSDLEYDTVMALPYLEAVCRETLRVYPPITQLLRTSRKDTILPLGQPIYVNGKTVMELFIPANTGIFVGVKAVNTSRDIWPDGNIWDPERWLKPLPESVSTAGIPGVYANTLTFNGGGRACIGFKFSELEMSCLVVANHKFPVFTVEGEHPVEVYEYRYTDGGWEDRDANHDGTCLSANLLVGLGF